MTYMMNPWVSKNVTNKMFPRRVRVVVGCNFSV
jgi:hypothetical protein